MNNTTDSAYKVRENLARRWARRHGFLLRKSRAQRMAVNNLGGYMLVDGQLNSIYAGERFDLNLDEVEAILQGLDEELEQSQKRPV